MTLRLNEEKISAKTSVLVYTQVENGNEYTAIAAVYDADKGEKKRFADIRNLQKFCSLFGRLSRKGIQRARRRNVI